MATVTVLGAAAGAGGVPGGYGVPRAVPGVVPGAGYGGLGGTYLNWEPQDLVA